MVAKQTYQLLGESEVMREFREQLRMIGGCVPEDVVGERVAAGG